MPQRFAVLFRFLCRAIVCYVATDCISYVVMLDFLAVIPKRKLLFPGPPISLMIE